MGMFVSRGYGEFVVGWYLPPRERIRPRTSVRSWTVSESDAMSDRRVSAESITTLSGPGGAAGKV